MEDPDFGYACHNCMEMVGDLTFDQATALANLHRAETRKAQGEMITTHAGIIMTMLALQKHGYPVVESLTHID